MRRQAELREDAYDDDLQAPATARTVFDVEGLFEQRRQTKANATSGTDRTGAYLAIEVETVTHVRPCKDSRSLTS